MLIEVGQMECAGVMMMMFVVLREGLVLDAERQAAIEDAIPRTISGKKQEASIKRLFSGQLVAG